MLCYIIFVWKCTANALFYNIFCESLQLKQIACIKPQYLLQRLGEAESGQLTKEEFNKMKQVRHLRRNPFNS